MSELPQYRKDLNDLAMIGADISLYMDLWAVLRDAESREDMAATKLFNTLHDMANFVRKIQEKAR